MLKTAPPILVADLFPELLQGLLDLLSSLSNAEWQLPTVCAGWTVKDVALHMLGVEIGNLSVRRDGHRMGASIDGWEHLVVFLNDWNEAWVRSIRRISTRLLVDLLQTVGTQMYSFFMTLDPFALGGSVAWAGPQPAPVWMDIAREYTERWHHQQHIRDAVNNPGFRQPRYMAPVLATFARALPRVYESSSAAQGAVITLTVTGDSGGQWSVRREADRWQFYEGTSSDQVAVEVTIADDLAWRLFTRGVGADVARQQMVLNGDQALGIQVLEMVSIIA